MSDLMERIRENVDHQEACGWHRDWPEALTAIREVLKIHVAVDDRSGYYPDDDDTPGAYGSVLSACRECGSQDSAVRWPCPTLTAIAAALGVCVDQPEKD